ncbi:aspartate aminotransferase family protein [Paraburkholderia sp. BL25I1N1]|uniref:aspartate aminotransferase family protein n=1 Tax=Paraburkholderia sp. BL25I1N1 TaxID=1938804 RepID=UPI000D061589|nr:aspartate aminotransferase family protein [Paraburkholderia sp. BL25I1N1]PRY04548.1 glutamate-1-semialdehyde 2,1-aminomutase [Paraburkholderia sp. BL25I1N1]
MNGSITPSRARLDAKRLVALHERERRHYAQANPHSQALAQRAAQHLMFGVPLHWMNDWSTPFPLHVAEACGARLRDVDGHEYVDFCLGDTGAMFGHSPQAVADAITRQARHGYTAMLPGEDGVWVAEELARRFGLPFWQFALSASDANRFAIRWARALTGRDQLLIFNGCYHGTVDDVFVDLIDGEPRTRDSLLGQVADLTLHTRCIEFNDLAALENALMDGRVACLLAEPAMTNIGMVLPDPGFWEQAQALCRRFGTLLLIDETHTISSGPNGYSRASGLTPDMLVLGKPIGGGVPCAVYGFTEDVARRAEAAKRAAPPGHSGIGTTLTANLITMAAMRATLADVMTAAAYERMFQLANHLATGLRAVIARHQLPWCVTQVGARTEFQFTPDPPRSGSEAMHILDAALEQIIHLYLLNRGLVITPFHNMMLVCPDTTPTDVSRLIAVFEEFVCAVVETPDTAARASN